MMTTDELRDLLAGEVAAPPQNIDRTSQVRGRVSATRRRRAVASSVAMVAVVAGAALVVPQLGDGSRTAPPAGPRPSQTGDVPLADYHLGGLLVAESQNIGATPFTVPFVASNNELMFTVDCYVPGARDTGETMVSLSVNGVDVGSTGCNDVDRLLGGSTFTPDPSTLSSVLPGRKGIVTVSFRKPVSAESRVRVGVYEKVPLESYQFPAQPDPLPALDLYGNLDRSLHAHPLGLLSAGPLPDSEASSVIVGPQGTWSGTFTLNHGLDIESQTVAPGELHFLVDGKEVASHFGWDYTNSGSGATLTLAELGVHKGDTVTLTVRADRFPGSSWAVLFSDQAP